MLNKEQMNVLHQLYTGLSDSQKQEFYDMLKDTKNTYSDNIHSESKDILLKEKHTEIICPFCGSKHTVKNGTVKKHQRFICKDCKKTFGYTENTIFKNTKINADTIIKYIRCFINKLSLKACAEECNISILTAFRWRHRILDSLRNMQDRVKLNGIIESDETYTAISYKGNRNIPRKAHKRGEPAGLRGLSREKACISCSVNHNGCSISGYSNLGKPKWTDIDNIIKDRIEEGSVFVTDSYKGYSKISYGMKLNHIRIARNKHSNGVFNIQLINNYHKQFKTLINRIFNGVATKYIDNYLVYHNFVNFSKGNRKHKIQSLLDFMLTNVFKMPKRVVV